MRIGVLGVGAVGILLGTRLSLTKNKIICLGSKKFKKHVKTRGITLKSEVYGSKKIFPNTFLKEGKVDILFISVKGTKLSEALKDYNHLLSKDTIAISLLNGMDYRETIRKKFRLKLIVGSIGSLEVFTNKIGEAIHKSKSNPTIELATSEKNLNKDMILINNLLNEIGINSSIRNNEEEVIWRKLARLTVISTITSMYNSSIGFALRNTESKQTLLKIIDEICLINAKIGTQLNSEDILKEINSLPYDLKTSMQRDINLNKESEIDYILKAPLEFGLKLGLDLPVMKHCYEVLSQKIGAKKLDER